MIGRFLTALGRGVVPPNFRPKLRRQWLKLLSAGTTANCCCCGSWLREFIPHGKPPEPDFLCPICRSKPPHRLSALLLEQHSEWFRYGGLVVHVAPEDELMKQLSAKARVAGMTYRSGGITGQGEFYLDLLNLPFEAKSVDLLFCCHVLNMVQDDLAAMKEVFRVLKDDGVALLQVPAFYEGPGSLESSSPEESLLLFNDSLMSRRYSDCDYVARLESVGFCVQHLRAKDFSDEKIQRHQLKGEVLHACSKGETHQ